VTHPALHTRLCELFGIRHPIVQTGMGWVAGARLASATSAAGGLGIVASATLTFDELVRTLHEVRERTDAPFGVNLRADADDARERADLLVREGVRVASFAMAPHPDLVRRLQDGGVLVVPSIGAKRHAEKVAAWGVDAVVVQGGEGGGHTGSVPTTLLLPQVVDALDVPVIAAGGFFDGRGLVAALAYGASGVAMGTRFLLTRESTVPDTVKRFYLERTVAETVVTTQVDGVPHRVLRTPLVDRLERTGRFTSLPRAARNAVAFRRLTGTSWRAILREGRAMKRSEGLTWSQVVMAANTPMLLRAALVEGRLDSGVMSSGQVVGVIDDLPSVAELVERIMAEADKTLERLGGGLP
jgi:NAD(P)H-dependent flavin oxidoreductase YrpB (nitropropane dioxygenase family)